MAEEQRARVGDLGDTRARHVEAADLVGGAEAVLECSHEAERGLPVALEVADDVDQVLEDAGPRDRPVFRDVADEDDGEASFFRHTDEGGRHLAHLGGLTRRAVAVGRRHRLHGVDDEQSRLDLVDVPEDRGEIGLGREEELVVQGPGALGAQPYLRRRLLSAGVEHAPTRAGALGGDLEQQRGLADARLPTQKDCRARHDAAAQHPVELAHSARAAWGVLRVDLGDPARGAGGPGSDGRDRPHDPGLFRGLDDRAPRLALAAAPDPLQRRPPALGAAVRGRGCSGTSGCHVLRLRGASDIAAPGRGMRWSHVRPGSRHPGSAPPVRSPRPRINAIHAHKHVQNAFMRLDRVYA